MANEPLWESILQLCGYKHNSNPIRIVLRGNERRASTRLGWSSSFTHHAGSGRPTQRVATDSTASGRH